MGFIEANLAGQAAVVGNALGQLQHTGFHDIWLTRMFTPVTLNINMARCAGTATATIGVYTRNFILDGSLHQAVTSRGLYNMFCAVECNIGDTRHKFAPFFIIAISYPCRRLIEKVFPTANIASRLPTWQSPLSYELDGTMKTAIITGASVGIGRASAQAFMTRGYEVYNLSRRPCPVEGVTNISCDLTVPDAIDKACDGLISAMGGSDSVALIHNACQMRKDSAVACTSESLREVLETNLVAVNSLNQRLLPQLPGSSSVLYIGSTLAEKAVAGSFSYVISKHALLGMMRASCQDLMGSGIHTALICPGFTDTEMLRTHLGNNEEVMQAIGAMNSYGRLIEPEEIAEFIFWAHHNPVINGSVLHANLGQKES